MPVSTETVAFIAASGAIAGALVGSVAGGVGDFRLERAREKRRAMVGARMVRAELATAAGRLKAIEDEGVWWDFYEFPMRAWATYEDALTARLEDVETVTQAVMGLTVISERMAKRPRTGPPGSTPVTDTDAVHRVRGDATAAHNALAKLAGSEPVVGLLHDDPPPVIEPPASDVGTSDPEPSA